MVGRNTAGEISYQKNYDRMSENTPHYPGHVFTATTISRNCRGTSYFEFYFLFFIQLMTVLTDICLPVIILVVNGCGPYICNYAIINKQKVYAK